MKNLLITILGIAALTFLAAFAFTSAGCTPGGAAFLKCELGKLPATIESVLVGIVSAVSQPSGALQALEDTGKGLAPGQFDCAVQAVEASLKGKIVKGEPTPLLQLQLKNLSEYLAKHKPVACREARSS